MSVDPSWPHKPSTQIRFGEFEVYVEVGCNNAEHAAEFFAIVQEAVVTRGRAMFPPANNLPSPCKGCGDGPK